MYLGHWLSLVLLRLGCDVPQGRVNVRRRQIRCRLECLEERIAPAIFVVTTTNDSGTGSLRQAILNANANAGADAIEFNIAGNGVQTIRPTSALPTITDSVFIDGYSQPGSVRNTTTAEVGGIYSVLLIELNGSLINEVVAPELLPNVSGLKISAPNSSAAGLVINQFPRSGIHVTATGRGSAIVGNYLGTDSTGTIFRGTQFYGIEIDNSAANVRIGGTHPEDRNLVSGNESCGIVLGNPGSIGNHVLGNLVGTDATGLVPLGNLFSGILISNQGGAAFPSGNVIGGTTPGSRNVISGNLWNGVEIYGGSNNRVEGNYIGVGVDGTTPVPNHLDGVSIGYASGATGNVIGGGEAGSENVISANGRNGVSILSMARANFVRGNLIGLDNTGVNSAPNIGDGVHIENSAGNTIGGIQQSHRNVISGNQGSGVVVTGSRATGNIVSGNFVGTDRSGGEGVANGHHGVLIQDASNNTIGASAPGQGSGGANVISGNVGNGVVVLGAGAFSNTVSANRIGTNVDGTVSVGNINGLVLEDAPSNRIEQNLISGNSHDGVRIIGFHANDNTLYDNVIGLSIDGAESIPNGNDGVSVENGSRNLIGGIEGTQRNIIAGNSRNGVTIVGPFVLGNSIRANQIYDNENLAIDLGDDGTTFNDVGDEDIGANDLMNFPVEIAFEYLSDIDTTLINGWIDSPSASTVTIDLYAGDESSGGGSVRTYLGSTTPAEDLGRFTFSVSGQLPVGQLVIATATDSRGSTSEFSRVRPMIFIPGIAGSRLIDGSKELWPGVTRFHDSLSLLPGEINPNIIPIDIVRQVSLRGIVDVQDVYKPLVDALVLHGGYREFVDLGENGTVPGTFDENDDPTHAFGFGHIPTLFVFPYDWRKSIDEVADSLAKFMRGIQKIYPDTDVDILTHSMGGLVARRYILENPTDNHVNKLVTLAAPFLGAAKMPFVLESGQFLNNPFKVEVPADFIPMILDGTTRHIVRTFKSAHELIASRDYYRLSDDPVFIEDGWDYNDNGNDTDSIGYEELVHLLDRKYPLGEFRPGSTGQLFHETPWPEGYQDDWSFDTTGVEYHQIYSEQAEDQTIVRLEATIGLVSSGNVSSLGSSAFGTYLRPIPGPGDGTVPTLSAERIGNGIDLNAPNARLYSFVSPSSDVDADYDHNGMTKNREIQELVLQILRNSKPPDSPHLVDRASRAGATERASPLTPESPAVRDGVGAALHNAFYLNLLGVESPSIRADAGEATSSHQGSFAQLPAGTAMSQLAQDIHLIKVSDAGYYEVYFVTTDRSISVEVTRGIGESIERAIRYVDLALPAGVSAKLVFANGQFGGLAYDSNNDGVFESIATPDADVSGSQSDDSAGPQIEVEVSPLGGMNLVTLSASDPSGVDTIYYVVNGQRATYQGSFTVESTVTSIHIIADDQLANRSVIRKSLSATPAAEPGVIAFDNASYEYIEGMSQAVISVVRSGGNDGQVAVEYLLTAINATEGDDFTSNSGVLVFQDGEASKTIRIALLDDALLEAPENIRVNLSSPTGGATLGRLSSAELTIIDDDSAGTFVFASPVFDIGETNSEATITVLRLPAGPSGPVSVQYATADGTGQNGSDYSAVMGTLNFAENEFSKTFTVPLLPDVLAEGTETVVLTLSNPTGGAVLGGQPTAPMRILDSIGPGAIQFASAIVDASEDAGVAVVTVHRLNGTQGVVTVLYSTSDDSALAGSDYLTTSGILMFADGESVKSFAVPIVDDVGIEGDESFLVTLGTPTGGATLNPLNKGIVEIADIEGPGTLAFSQASYETNEGNGLVTITISRTGGAQGEIAVDFSTTNGTGTAGVDYVAASGTLVFVDGELSKTFTVPILDDMTQESVKSIVLTIQNPTGGAVLGSQSTAILNITDLEGEGVIQFAQDSYEVNEAADNATIEVTRTGSTQGVLVIDLSVSDIDTIAGRDYSVSNQSLAFQPGESSRVLNIPIVNDRRFEGLESLQLSLSLRYGRGTLGPFSTATLDIIDDDSGTTFMVTNTNDSGAGSLRQAILSANALFGPDLIAFSIPGSGVKTISPLTNLPAITDPVTIDGYTQAGSSKNTSAHGNNAVLTIELSGAAVTDSESAGLRIRTNNTVIRGLVINRFRNGIFLSGTPSNVSAPVLGSSEVNGNFIGTAPDGVSARGNTSNGILIATDGNFQVSQENLIGGTAPALSNIIAFNEKGVNIGVDFVGMKRNSVRGNSIFSNESDLSTVSPAVNLAFEGRTSPISISPFMPVVEAARTSAGGVTISGRVDIGLHALSYAPPFQVDLFASTEIHLTGYGEGRLYLGQTTTDDAQLRFGATLPWAAADGVYITATATDALGNTSEFSARYVVDQIQQLPLTVNTTDDVDDGVADATHTSLREAIHAANSRLGHDVIQFNIPGAEGAVRTIRPTRLLPPITGPTTIDGYSQPGSRPNTSASGALDWRLLIELDGSGVANGRQPFIDGLYFSSSGNLVRGLVINRFAKAGLYFEGRYGNRVEGNILGMDASGIIARGNAVGVVFLNTFGSVVGGTVPEARNLISGNTSNLAGEGGIWIEGKGGNSVLGNYIGLNSLGVTGPGNTGNGIVLNNSGSNRIGGAEPGAGNVISRNGSLGVSLRARSNKNRILGNIIQSNGRGGILIDGNENLVGGIAAGEGNVISSNSGEGVDVLGDLITSPFSVRNSIRGNSIYSNVPGVTTNVVMGINLRTVSTGPNPNIPVLLNDANDTDMGGNNAQNKPVLHSATSTLDGLTVHGSLTSTQLSAYAIDFYATPRSAQTGASGFGQGKTFLGSVSMMTDSTGAGLFTITLPVQVLNNDFITATATDASGNTSEFSARLAVGDVLTSVIIVNSNNDVDDGVADAQHTSLREAIHAANNHPGPDQILFDIPGTGVRTISLTRTLPAIVDTVTLDGFSQPGSSANTLTEGDNAVRLIRITENGITSQVQRGLQIRSQGSVVRGLILSNTAGIELVFGGGNHIEGNQIGLESLQGNYGWIRLWGSTGNVIGGSIPAARNVIGGSIQIVAGSHDTLIQGNYIGTNREGMAALSDGITTIESRGVQGADSINTTIGGTAPGTGNVIRGSVILGGVGNVGQHVVQGNMINVNRDGTAILYTTNVLAAVLLTSGFNTIGGTLPAARNIIGGNISINGSDNLIEGNYIGTDITGTVSVVRGLGPRTGVNLIATSAMSSDRNRVLNNLISGFGGGGIGLEGSTTLAFTASDNIIQGNLIGTQVDGSSPLGNDGRGIVIFAMAEGNVFGGTEAGQHNVIAFNGGGGIYTEAAVAPRRVERNTFLSNRIYSNGGMGIDLGSNGHTANDAGDADSGANRLQNYPVIASALVGTGRTVIEGTLNSLPSATFTLQFYLNPVADGSGFGEGQNLLNSTLVTTDSSGNAEFRIVFLREFTIGEVVTATATDAVGNTSEFSLAVAVAPEPVESSPTSPYQSQSEFSDVLIPIDNVGTEPNQAPTLGAIGSKLVIEGALLTFTVTASDTNVPPNQLTFSMIGAPAGAGIDPTTGVFTWTPSEEDGPNDFTFTIRVTDNGDPGLFDEEHITVTVEEINSAPMLDPLSDYDVEVGTAVSFTATASDLDLPANRLIFELIGAPEGAVIDPGTGEFAWNPTGSQGNQQFTFTIRVVDDGSPILFDEQQIRIGVISAANTSPVFTSPETFEVPENSNLAGTIVAKDLDLPAQFVVYSITGGADAAKFAIASDGQFLFISAPDFEDPRDANADNVYQLQVTADDGNGGVTTQQITVTVTPLNDNDPIFTSPASFNVTENTTAVGTIVAHDDDLPAQSVTFSISGGVDAARFVITGGGVLTFAAAPDFENPLDAGTNNVYDIQVTASDGNGGISVRNIEVTVTRVNDNLPVFSSPAAFNVAENQSSVGAVVATDADLPGQFVDYSITGGADAAKFAVDSGGNLIFTSAPDFENPQDAGANNVYNVQVTANDGNGGTTSQNITVTVTPLNDDDPIFTSPTTFSVSENTSTVGTMVAFDDDLPAQTVSFSISGGPDAARFTINSAGVLSFVVPPDFENPADTGANNVYDLQVQASDGNGGTSTRNITVTVTPVNDNLPILSSPATVSVLENSNAVGTVVATDADLPAQGVEYSISGGADAAKFAIDSNGQLVFTSAPDFETPRDVGENNVYNVQVTADDGNGGTTTQNITVSVTPVNDNDPIFTSGATYSLPENTVRVGTLAASDDDLPAQVLTFSISGGPDAARFVMQAGGVLRFVSAPDFENPADAGANNVYDVQVTISDGNGGVAVRNIEVTVTRVNDNLPIFWSPAAFNVAENVNAVGTVVATDADSPAQFVDYSITGGDDATKFAVDSNGNLILTSAPDFEDPQDANGDNVYQVQVTANDGNGGTTTQSITVTVTPLNDNDPLFTSPAALSIPENATTVGTMAAFDEDLPTQTLSFSISGGPDALRFVMSGEGVLSFAVAPDFENPADADANNVYELQVQVSDGSGRTATRDITLTVTGANDHVPVFTSPTTFTVPENSNSVGTVVSTDADLPGQRVGYSITGGADAARFAMDAGGNLVFTSAPDFEIPQDVGADNVYHVQVTADDGHGGLTTQDIIVTVTAINDHDPVFTSPPAYNTPENSTTIAMLIATDADLPTQVVSFLITGGLDATQFAVSSEGLLAFVVSPDFEQPADANGDNIYELQVTADDGLGGLIVQDIMVTVTDVNEAVPGPHLDVGQAVTFFKKQPPVIVVPQIVVSGTSVLEGGSLVLTMNLVGSKKKLRDQLVLPDHSQLGFSSGPQVVNRQLALEIQLNAAATNASIQEFLRGITFTTKGKGLKTTSRTVTLSLTAANGEATAAMQTIQVRRKVKSTLL